MSEEKLSTTRLAEQAGIELKQLFRLLAECGWIVRDGKQWRLTAHGEFEGGSYQKSEKFGEYIVWPKSVLDNPLISNFVEPWLSATRLGELNGISATCINQMLTELGWLEKDQRGWMLTELGTRHGGSQRNGKHGFYVLWPKDIRNNRLFADMAANVNGSVRGPCLDGHAVDNAGEQVIDNWLYLQQLPHAFRHPIPGSDYHCSFFLPQRRVFIDYWGFDFSTGSLSEKMARQDFYKANGLRYIELGDDDLPQINEALRQKLLPFGIQIGN